MSNNVVSILQKGSDIEAVFVNDTEFGMKFCLGLNKLLGEGYTNYELKDFHIEGKVTDGVDKISLIMENESVIKVYINLPEEAQKDFDRLPRQDGFVYCLIQDFEEYNLRKGNENEH